MHASSLPGVLLVGGPFLISFRALTKWSLLLSSFNNTAPSFRRNLHTSNKTISNLFIRLLSQPCCLSFIHPSATFGCVDFPPSPRLVLFTVPGLNQKLSQRPFDVRLISSMFDSSIDLTAAPISLLDQTSQHFPSHHPLLAPCTHTFRLHKDIRLSRSTNRRAT